MTRQEVGMHVTFVHVRVLPDQIDAFLEATRENHEGSVREPGNLRFDVLRDPADHSRFLVYEVFLDDDAAAAHKATPHYLAWRDRVAQMMAEPRHGDRWDALMVDVTPASRPQG
jgi:autoinducer 2-degrading protein